MRVLRYPALLLAALLVMAQSPATPTPLRPAPKPAFVTSPSTAPPPRAKPQSVASNSGFVGATRCEQTAREIVCDNGYRKPVR